MIGPMKRTTERLCGFCTFFIDYCQLYEDPEEPRDYGECRKPGKISEPHSVDDPACELFKHYKELEKED